MVETNFKHTEIGLIPHDWEVKTLEESTQRVSVGLATSVTKYYSRTGVPMFRNLNIKENRLDDSDILYLDETFANANPTKKIHKDDVLTVHTGYVGISCVVPEKYEGALTFTTLITTTKRDLLSPNYLSLYLNSNMGMNEVSLLQAGGGRNNLNVNDFINLRITLPPTLAEQERIAGALSSIDTLIGALNKQIEKKRHIKQGTMQQLLTGKKRLTKFTEKWKEVVFGDVVGIYRGGSPRPIENYLTTDPSGINWIKIGDVGVDAKYIEHTAEKIIPEGISRSRKVYSGDFLLSNSMSFGRPYILKIDGCIHDGWLVIQNYQETFDREFLYYILSSNAVLLQYKALAAGSSVLNLNKDIVAKVQLTIPPTIAEQSAIAAVLSGMDTEIAALEQKRDKYIAIKSGMMQDLLTGKIRLV